jgi:hypothetical protein
MTRRKTSLLGLTLTAILMIVSGRLAYSATIVGVLDIVPDDCSGALTGSFFQMYGSTGGQLVGFSGEGCSASGGSAGTFPLTGPRTLGRGLHLDAYQYDNTANPNGSGYTGIINPFLFFGSFVYLNTSPIDYQTGSAVAAPHLEYDETACVSHVCPIVSSLSNTTAWGLFWIGNNHNQGAPKPEGSFPSHGADGTVAVSGTYNSATRAYVIQWRSLFFGGGVNGFTGHWQLAGTVSTNSPTNTPTPTNSPTPCPTEPLFIHIIPQYLTVLEGETASSTVYVTPSTCPRSTPPVTLTVSTLCLEPVFFSINPVTWTAGNYTPSTMTVPTTSSHPQCSIAVTGIDTNGEYTVPDLAYLTVVTATPTPTSTHTPTETPTPTPLSACEQQWGVTSFTANGNKGKLSAMVVGNIVDPTNIKGKGTRISLCAGTSVSVLVSDTSGTPTNTALTTGIACDSSGCQVGSLQGRQKFLSESNDGTDKLRITLLAY